MIPARFIAFGIVVGAVFVSVIVPMIGHSESPAPGAQQVASLSPAAARPVVPVVPKAETSVAGGSSTDTIRVLLIPSLDTTLSSPVAGRMRMLNSSLGASFAAGAVLVSFDCDEPVARLNMAKAEYAGAQETHEAKIRLQGLDQASQVEVAMAASVAAKARAAVALSDAQVAQCNVHAPWAGRIAKVHVRNNMSVTPGQPLLDLVKTGPLKLKLSVPSRWLQTIHPGVPFAVAIEETGKRYQAKIVAMNSRVDPVSQTIEIEADMAQNYPELLAGMSGTAQFPVTR